MYIGQLVTFSIHVNLSNCMDEGSKDQGTNSGQVNLSIGYITICQGNQPLLECV